MRTLLALAALALLPDLAAAQATTYDLSADSGRLYVVVRAKRGGLLSGLGHDHVVVASRFRGEMTWDPSDPSACDVQLSFPASALVVDPGSARSWAELDGETSDGDKAKIRDNLLGRRQLEADRFSTVSYQSTGCELQGDLVAVQGGLTLHGVTHTVTVPMRIRPGEDSITASGQFDATHADFGMEPFSAMMGALRNDEGLSFFVDVRGTARPSPADVADAGAQ